MFHVGDWVANAGMYKQGLPTNPGLVVGASRADTSVQKLQVFWTGSNFFADNVLVDGTGLLVEQSGRPEWADEQWSRLVPVAVSVVRHKYSRWPR